MILLQLEDTVQPRYHQLVEHVHLGTHMVYLLKIFSVSNHYCPYQSIHIPSRYMTDLLLPFTVYVSCVTQSGKIGPLIYVPHEWEDDDLTPEIQIELLP